MSGFEFNWNVLLFVILVEIEDKAYELRIRYYVTRNLIFSIKILHFNVGESPFAMGIFIIYGICSAANRFCRKTNKLSMSGEFQFYFVTYFS